MCLYACDDTIIWFCVRVCETIGYEHTHTHTEEVKISAFLDHDCPAVPHTHTHNDYWQEEIITVTTFISVNTSQVCECKHRKALNVTSVTMKARVTLLNRHGASKSNQLFLLNVEKVEISIWFTWI